MMKRQKWKDLLLILILLNLPFLPSCAKTSVLDKIKESGEITVLTRNNAHCYYTYRDNPMGFEYDLARAFSDYLGVKLKVITPPWEELFDVLNGEEGDFIAASLTITPSREKLVDFSDEYLTIQQQAVIHTKSYQIRKLEDLKRETIHVRRGTSYEERLNELKSEGLGIKIELCEDTPTEELIRMVAEKEIEVTIADSNIALLNRRYYPDVKIAFPIEEPESLGWAVKKGETALQEKINEFFKIIKEDGTFAKIYEKYYANYERYDGAKDPDRVLIALASYNVGHGHILDAQKIAKERNLNPNNWSSLEEILPLLRYPKYYRKTKNGYARGTEAVRYVNRILTYYGILKREAIS